MSLDGPGIRNANRPGSRKSIRRRNLVSYVRAIRANRLKPAMRNYCVPRNAVRKEGILFGNPENDARLS